MPMSRIGLMVAVLVCLAIGPAARAETAADPVAADRSRALHDDPQASAALVRVLRHHYAQSDGEGGFEWWLRLPFPVRARQALVPTVRFWRNRLEFLRDAQRGDAAACAVTGAMVLADPLIGVEERAVERERLRSCNPGHARSEGGP